MPAPSFCSFCGARFPEGAGWPRRCPACTTTTYRNPLPVAVVLVPVEDGGLLLIRRAIEPQVGKLALPGGYVNDGETWQEAEALRPPRVTCWSWTNPGAWWAANSTPAGFESLCVGQPARYRLLRGDRSVQSARAWRGASQRTAVAVLPAATFGWPTKERSRFAHIALRQGRRRDQPCRTLFRTLRSHLSRPVRKTYFFFKRIERHLGAIHLFLASYNLRIKEATINPNLQTP